MWHRGRSGKLGMLRRRRSGRVSNFPINCYYRTNKLQSGTFVLAAPLPPLSHTSCDSPNHNPWAIREVPVHVSPGAGPLSQGNQYSQWIDQTSSELTGTWLSARSKLSFCLSLPSQEDCCQVPQPRQRLSAPDWWNSEIVKSEIEEDRRLVIKRQCSSVPSLNFLFQAHQFASEIVIDKVCVILGKHSCDLCSRENSTQNLNVTENWVGGSLYGIKILNPAQLHINKSLVN